MFLVFLISVSISIIVLNFKGDEWENKIRNAFYHLTKDSITNYALEKVDERGVPYVYYAKQNGVNASTQYNPTIITNYAYNYYLVYKKTKDEKSKQNFFNCVHWLQDNLTVKNNYAFYSFNWQQPWYDSVKTPFTSAMTSGLAIRAFVYAYKITNSPHYLYFSNLLLRGFYVPIQEGGFTYREKNGWWFEEIADKNMNTPRILDGHIFAIQGLQTYWNETKEDSIRNVIDQGLLALIHYLPHYNARNGKIYYDKYKKIADKKYQQVIVNQMNLLWLSTNKEVFKKYYNEWNAPLIQPYIYRIFKEFNRSGIILFLIIEMIFFFVLILFKIQIQKFIVQKKRLNNY